MTARSFLAIFFACSFVIGGIGLFLAYHTVENLAPAGRAFAKHMHRFSCKPFKIGYDQVLEVCEGAMLSFAGRVNVCIEKCGDVTTFNLLDCYGYRLNYLIRFWGK